MRPAFAHHRSSPTACRRASALPWTLTVMMLFGTRTLGAQVENPSSGNVPSASQQIVEQSRAISLRMQENGITRELIDQQRELLRQMEHWLTTEAGENSAASLNKESDSAEKKPRNEPSLSPSNPSPENSPGVMSEIPTMSPASQRALEDAVWGHLPPQERDPLIRAFNERFLPEYDQRVRAYFEALAKRPRKTLEPRE